VPSFQNSGRLVSGDLRAALVRCDGHDGTRAEAETVESERLWIVVSGRFAWRGRRGRAVADPATALLLTAGEPFEIRHPHGSGDVCLSVAGAVVGEAVGGVTAGPRPLSLAVFLRWSSLAARLRSAAPIEALEFEETVCATVDPAPPETPGAPGQRQRAVAEAIEYQLKLGADEVAPLSGLAASAGVSVFHACRVFRRVYGTSIHQRKKTLRLRHAIAHLLDTRWPLARIAAECGYASQAHMTNHFSSALGITPRALRESHRPRGASCADRVRNARSSIAETGLPRPGSHRR
jgi:AraC-like DNA-binding protein